MAVADARPDGTVHIYTHNQNPQALRGEIAQMLGTTHRSHRGAHVRRPGPLRTIERRERRRGRRSGDPVEGRGQAGARAVDAAGGFPVVHAIAGCVARTSKSDWTRTARWSRIRSTTTCPPCRTTGPSARCSPACRPCRLPARKAMFIGSTVNDISDPWIYDGVADSDGTRPRHIPGRPESFAARHRTARSQHADAGTVPAELSRANWRSARQRRWPARTPSSSASTTRRRSA